jgi:protein-S-isoprenylcysteine O-methyltransferase
LGVADVANSGIGSGNRLREEVPWGRTPRAEWLWPVLGCAVGLAGVTLRWQAIRTLGVHFTRDLRIGADHQLVSGGPYRRVRHPSYTGAILVFAGVGIGLGNSLSLVACALLPAIGYIQRIPTEEALLRREIGDPYIEYSRHTDRLIPGIW